MDDNKIDKIVKNLSVVFLVVCLLSTILVGFVLTGSVLYDLQTTQPPEMLLTILWIFFIVFWLIYTTIFYINYPSRPEGIKKRKERNPLAEKLLTITGMILFWSFLVISVFVVLMVVWSLLVEFPTMLSLEAVLFNLGSIIAIFFIQLFTLYGMNHGIKKVEQKKKQERKRKELKRKLEINKHIPKTVKSARNYLIMAHKKGYYKPKLETETFRKELGGLDKEQIIKDYFDTKEEQTLIMLDLYAK